MYVKLYGGEKQVHSEQRLFSALGHDKAVVSSSKKEALAFFSSVKYFHSVKSFQCI